MSNLQVQNFNLQTLPKNYNNNKKNIYKNSYNNNILEKRKQAINFVLKGKNNYEYNNSNNNYINNKKNLFKNINNNNFDLDLFENEDKFYKTYNILKNNIKEEKNPKNNVVFIEKENNKYYLSQGFPEKNNNNLSYNRSNSNCCPYCNHCRNQINNELNNIYNYFGKSNQEDQELIDALFTNEDNKDKINNNIRHHSINLTSKNKQNEIKNNINSISLRNKIFSKTDNNWNNHKNHTIKINNYIDKNKNMNDIELKSSPNIKNKKYYIINNLIEDYNRNNKFKSSPNPNISANKNINIISSIKSNQNNNKENIDNKYYEGLDNHRFYDSSNKKDYIYKYEVIKPKEKYPRNLSDPTFSDKNKKLYIVKNMLNSNNDYDNNTIEKNQINELSPIRTHYRYEYEDNNEDFPNIGRIYDSQSLNGNSIFNSNNLRFKNSIKSPNSNYENNQNPKNYNKKEIRTKSEDIINNHSTKIIKDTGNTKTISIVCKSQTIPINENESYDQKGKDIDKINNNNNIDLNNKNNIKIKNNKENNNIINNDINKNNELKKAKTSLKAPPQANNINPKIKNKDNVIENYKNGKKINNDNYNKLKNENNIYNNINKQEKNNKINEDMKNDNNNIEEYPKIVDQEQNFDTIKDKYESFLRQKNEKEPNLQSKEINSNIISKEEPNLTNNKINENIIKNIQDKIRIIKNNNNKNHNKNININYINEIDNYISKLKKKEEKDNLLLNEFYQELLLKENEDNINYDNRRDFLERINNIDKNILNKNKNKSENKNKNKTNIIKRSNRLQNMIKQILNNKRYGLPLKKYNSINSKFNPSKTYHPHTQKEYMDIRESTIKKNFNESNNNKVPDINLIVDENSEENNKIMDENEYNKLKNKNSKSSRPIILMNKHLSLNNSHNKKNIFTDRFDLYGFHNYDNEKFKFNINNLREKIYVQRALDNSNNKIMPPNEI